MSVAIVDDAGNTYYPQALAFDNDQVLAEALQQEQDEITAAISNSQDAVMAAALQQAVDEDLGDKRAAEILTKKTYTAAQLGLQPDNYPSFTYSMIVIISVIMGVELLVNNAREGEYYEDPILNPLIGPSEDTLLFLGAKRADLIVDEGDWWRLFVPLIVHAGVIHLFFNIVFLYSFGISLEKEFGHLRVAYIFFLSGVVGLLFSAILNPTEPTVGASGACYGLIGASWAEFMLNFTYYRDNNTWKSWLGQLIFGTALNLCLGLIPTLDNFAHIGGFFAGIFSGLQVLTLPRYNYFLEEKPDQWHQIFLKAIAYFLTPVALVILFVILYTGVDASAYCPACSKFNCLPTPFWLCDVDCSEPFAINPQPNGDIEIECPRDLGVRVVLQPEGQEELFGDVDAQVTFCEEHCLGT